MFKQSPSRNQRSKGIKIKAVLQICLLLAVCFWLLYQVKRSHDKKKDFDEHDAKRNDEVVKLGRKDLHPQVEKLATKNEKHDEEVEEEESVGGEEEVEENEHEEEEQEDGNSEEKDEEVDNHDKEKSHAEIDREESSIDDEKEREDSDEQESEEKDSEDSNGKTENDSSFPDQDREEGGGNTREAREENYKADDASSAVEHDTQITTAVNENVNLEKSNGTSNEAIEINANHNPLVEMEDGETTNNGSKLAESTRTVNEIIPSNSTMTEESDDQLEVNNNSTEVSAKTPNLNGTALEFTRVDSVVEGDGTVMKEDSTLQSIAPEVGNNSTQAISDNQFDSNLTISMKSEGKNSSTMESLRLSGDTESSISKTMSSDDKSDSLVVENNGATEDVKDDQTAVMKERLDETNAEISDEMQQNPVDSSTSSISLEEKDVRTDLETLPEIQTEGSNNDDVAAE